MARLSPDVAYRADYETFRWDIPARLNVAEAVCLRQPSTKLALIEGWPGGRRATFGDIAAASARLANGLAALGVTRGERVAVMLPQGLEAAVAHVAVYRMGAIVVPLSLLFREEAIKVRIADSGARAAIIDPSAEVLIETIRQELDSLDHVIVAAPGEDGPGTLAGLCALASSSPGWVDTFAEEPSMLVYTSGTTGAPKGVLHAHRVLLGHLPGFYYAHDRFPQRDSVAWTPADWAWIGGMYDLWLPAWYYGRPVLAHPAGPFDPELALTVVARYGATNAFIPPTALRIMRRVGVGIKPTLHSILTGGEVLGSETLSWCEEELGVVPNEIYGQTEANLFVGNCGGSWQVKPGSMGRALPGHVVEVREHEADRTCPPGTLGEICLRDGDPVEFVEYWRQPEATAEKRRDGWIRTGDEGVMDEDGFIYFHGRADDIINSAGHRIGPAEIEETLVRHPAVGLAAAIGVPDEERGEVVKAYVVLRPGFEPTEVLGREIKDYVRNHLSLYQYPRLVEFVPDLPVTATGKVIRADLRRRERNGH